MGHLNNDHIAFIIKDLNGRGIVLEGFEDEVIDHVCAAVEAEMAKGKRFADAYGSVLRTFGSTRGLQRTQHQILRSENQRTAMMIRNYLTVAWRNLRRQRFYSLINIGGLAMGIAACLIIILFITDELSYDKHHANAGRIYRVNAEVKFGGNHFNMAYRSAPEAQVLLQDYPEVESVVRLHTGGVYLVRAENTADNRKERNVIWADSSFFSVFNMNVLEGNATKALAAPTGIAISKHIAEKYFPGISAIGQGLILDNNYHCIVMAVFADMPVASHFHFDIMVSMTGQFPIAKEARSTSFMSENFHEYILLRPGANPKALERKLPAFLEKYMGPEIAAALGSDFTMEKFNASGSKYVLSLMPLTDIHLHADMKGELEPNGNIVYVYLFAIIAAVILIIACINFMNLSTARSANRSKEVGIRKVMGSIRSHLVRQFLTESMLVTSFAVAMAIALAYVFLPVFNELSGKQLRIPVSHASFYGILALATIVIGTLAGLYPAFFLSAFRPAAVLKGTVSTGMKNSWIRSILVVFQFTISIILIIGAIAVNRQLSYIQNKKLGFRKDQVIIVHDAYALRPNNVKPFKEEALKQSGIITGTISGYVPVETDGAWRSNSSFWKDGDQPRPENMIGSQLWGVDIDYLKTFRMEVIKGRGFSTEFRSDSAAVVINETALKRLGVGDDPIGKKIHTFDGAPDPEHIQTWTIIGVVEDFHFSSLKESITPLGLTLSHSDGHVAFLFEPAKTAEVIKSLEAVWKKLAPGQPFQYSFLDEDFENMYHSEERLGQIFSLFAGFAIIIACLGLFALTAFTAEQRTKEIGIRKVLGASAASIVFLLSRDFGKLILIAFILSVPVAWYGINWWLKSYTYKTEIGVIIYLLAGALALVIALLTMGYQSVQAANLDPAKSLRSE